MQRDWRNVQAEFLMKWSGSMKSYEEMVREWKNVNSWGRNRFHLNPSDDSSDEEDKRGFGSDFGSSQESLEAQFSGRPEITMGQLPGTPHEPSCPDRETSRLDEYISTLD
ncbi:Hypothetical protein NTJ_09788 [Nesidiocoris tenuis]|uniref:Uncharacterized protein n=1 Tax=Nesidiocoris tenuis TaxID=355587 RepID=A0ABN7B195_9HEMI|nr:Hypothetical protein NTJ_09788 [Nesidiocoris tenuis]